MGEAKIKIETDIPVRANGEVTIHEVSQKILIAILIIVAINLTFSVVKYFEDKTQNERIEKLENGK